MDLITPINTLIDKTEELLGHSPHPAVVLLPVGGWAVSNICDAIGMLSGNETFDDAARISMGIGLAGASVAVVTGLRDYGFIPEDRPSHEVATRHAVGNAVAGSLMAASFVMRSHDHMNGRRPSLLARTLGLAGGGLALYTAWLGGKLVQEYGEAVKPVMDALSESEEDDDARGRARLSPESPLGTRAG